MAEAYIVAAARTAGGRKGGRLAGWHPADLAASVLDSLVDRTGADPAQIEDVIMGCVMQAGEQSNNIARNAVMASKLPESVPAHLDRPPVRLVAAGAAFRGAGGDVRHDGHRDRRRRGIDDAGADGPRLAAAGQERLWPLQEPGHREEISEHHVQPVHRRGNDGGEIRPLQGRARRIFLQQPPARDRRDAGRQVQGRDRSAADHPRRRLDRHPPYRRRHPLRRQPRRHQGRQADRRERQAHRRQRQPDLRRRLRRDGRQRKGPEVARRQADGAHPSHDHDGRRSRDHAGCAAARHQARAGEGRHVDRRHRPVRGQRGLRLGADRRG